MDTERILFELFIIFTAGKLAGEVFERLRQPPVIGELIVGVALGAHALGVISDTEINRALQELGAIVLLFMVGLDTRVEELRRVGGRAFSVGVSGIVLPFAFGAGLVYVIDGSLDEAMFLGAAMVATSVGITARVLSDLGTVREPESRVILGAAIVDDVLGLLLLGFVTGLGSNDLSLIGLIALAVVAIGFVAVVGAFGHRATRALAPTIETTRISRAPLAAAIALCLGLSALAGAVGLAAIVGAFLAGMAFSDLRPRWDLEDQVEPVYEFLVPFFFVMTGARLDPEVLVEPSTLGLVVAVTVLAIIGKVAGCGLAASGMGRRSALIVGIGMVPRGEVGIVVASVGLGADLIQPDMYGVIVAMSILTTLAAPPFLKALFAERARSPTSTEPGHRTEEIEGI